MHLRCGYFLAHSMLSRPVAPPTSRRVLDAEKSNFLANASKLILESPAIAPHELFEPGQFFVKLLEYRLLPMFGFVLAFPWAKR